MSIERLAKLRGIGDAYHDYRGELHYFRLQTKTAILRAMGCRVDDPVGLGLDLQFAERYRWRKLLPSIASARGGHLELQVNISSLEFGANLIWTVQLEDGAEHRGAHCTADCPEVWRGEVDGTWITRRCFVLPVELPYGYHEMEMRIADGPTSRCLVISSPLQCYEPSVIAEGRRLWGVAVQLYTLRSRDNWGIGDFGDLNQLIRWLVPHGAGFIGLNPLHALAPADPERCSPYSASSRHYLNVLYISVPQVEELQECVAALVRIAETRFADRLSVLRASEHVNYAGVAAVKFEIFELLYQEFADRHLARNSERARKFRAFVASGGKLLQLHARFDALNRHFRATTAGKPGWMSWPQEFRDAAGEAATRFAQEHPASVEFFIYLQWLAHEQLRCAQSLARELGMPVGLYGDYAVGANPSGSETWVDRTGYVLGAEIGAPPDPLALKGQGWGIPPQDPFTMEVQRLQGFVRLIRGNMRYYGALRLDHVMSLFRLWWVAAGNSPAEGAYVHYPLQELLSILAIESARSRCLVVGEDLGVVPDEIRHAMPQFGLYHYKVLLFEKQDGRFRRPDELVRRALATVTTHDMPTIISYWQGHDIELRQRLNLYPGTEIYNEVQRERAHDRVALLAALQSQGLAPAKPASPLEPFTAELAQALHLYLARSNTRLVSLQIEDLLGMIDPVNVPGTDGEYPNWQRKLTMDVKEMALRLDLSGYFAEINRAREA